MAKIPDFLNESSYRQFVTATAFFAKIVPISALVLYCSVVWLSSLFYEEIRLDMERTYKVNQENIRRWKCSLALAGEVVDGISDTFGLILLISINHFFIDLICHSFSIYKNILNYNLLQRTFYVVNVVRKFFFLWFIVFTSTEIHRKVCYLSNNSRMAIIT